MPLTNLTVSIPGKGHLPLPKFTFLCGAKGNGQEDLALAIAALDPDLGIFDLEEPIRMATSYLFFGGYNLDHDFTKADQIKAPLPVQVDQSNQFPISTVEDWMLKLRETLEQTIGLDVLGQIAVNSYVEDGVDFPRLLYRDCTNASDIAVFVSRFDPSNCLAIQCGELQPNYSAFKGVKQIWLPVPNIESRMSRIRHDLESVR